LPPHVWHAISRLRVVDMLEPLPLAAGAGFFVVDTLETGLMDEVELSVGRVDGANEDGTLDAKRPSPVLHPLNCASSANYAYASLA
jgi:hypothetical protein